MTILGIDPGQRNWAYFLVDTDESVSWGGVGADLCWKGEHPRAVVALADWLLGSWAKHGSFVVGIEKQLLGRRNVLRAEAAFYTLAYAYGFRPVLVETRQKKVTRFASLPQSWQKRLKEAKCCQHVKDAAWIAWKVCEMQGLKVELKGRKEA